MKRVHLKHFTSVERTVRYSPCDVVVLNKPKRRTVPKNVAPFTPKGVTTDWDNLSLYCIGRRK